MSNQIRPNLFVIGAMKSGTSSLHAMLAKHPAIFMSEPKEPCYFVEPALLERLWPEMWRLGFWKSEQAYLNLFSEAVGATYVGESSTDYTKLPLVAGVADKIAAFSPRARFIYIMRDPIQRTISHYWHMVEHRGERRPPLEAVQNERQYTDVSYYAYQLRPYLEKFGADSVYTLTFEGLARQPTSAMEGIYSWLGVEASVVANAPREAKNVTPDVVAQKRGMGRLEQFRHSEIWDRLSPFVPSGIRRLGVAMVEKKISRADVNMDEVVAYLRPIQQRQTQELIDLLQKEFPEWKTLNAS